MKPTHPILLVVPFHSADIDLAFRMISWIQLLDQNTNYMKEHHVLLAADGKLADSEDLVALKTVAGETFKSHRTMIVSIPDDRQGWPKGPNYMFQAVAHQIQETCKLPWLWLEPDCVPLNANWLRRIEEEYAMSPKLLMGAVVSGTINKKPVRHMSGVAVYPPIARSIMKETALMEEAFDLATSALAMPRMAETRLIQHYWGNSAKPPKFVKQRALTDEPHVVDPSILSEEAVLFHRSKDGSLITILLEILMEERGGNTVNDRRQVSPETEIFEKPAPASPSPEPAVLLAEDLGSSVAETAAKEVANLTRKMAAR